MPIATPESYAEMLDKAKRDSFALSPPVESGWYCFASLRMSPSAPSWPPFFTMEANMSTSLLRRTVSMPCDVMIAYSHRGLSNWVESSLPKPRGSFLAEKGSDTKPMSCTLPMSSVYKPVSVYRGGSELSR